jgi:octaprenyl-diphosphate synthase
MAGMLQLAGVDSPLADLVDAELERVEVIFQRQLHSDLPPVRDLCEHVERYSGKMLRPTLLLLAGLAGNRADARDMLGDDHRILAATIEMVHMSTLVHDDILDEADTRRRQPTVNRLHGNETAVILGDYLISNAYHLALQAGDPGYARAIAETTNIVCEGELLQLHHRENLSLDEPTYFEIIDRKTASLVGLACRLGALASGAETAVSDALDRFGRELGIAFQIRDDLLDLMGETEVVGKSLGKDIEKGKLTLPVIHHLASCSPTQRGRSIELIDEVEASGARAELVEALRTTRSIEHSVAAAGRIVENAKGALVVLPEGPARQVLTDLAAAVVARSY